MENQEYTDEISLKELLEVLLKNKFVILLVALTITLISAIYTFIFIEPMYEASLVMMPYSVDTSNQMAGTGDNIEDVLNQLTAYPTLTLETYKEQMTSDAVMIKTIEMLGVSDSFTYESLKNKITIETNKDSNNIVLKVKDKDSDNAALIANTIKDVFIDFVTQLNQKQLDQSIEFLNTQVAIEKVNLDNALGLLEGFLKENSSSEELRQELSIKRASRNVLIGEKEALLSNYEQKNIDYGLQVKLIDKKIEITENLLENEKPTVTLLKDIYSDLSLYDYFKSLGINVENVNIEVQEVNEIYYTLKSSLNQLYVDKVAAVQEQLNLQEQYRKQLDFYNTNIDVLTSDVEILNINLSKNESQENLLISQVDHAKSTYEALLNKKEAVRITEAAKLSENSLMVISQAYAPSQPISPNKMLNLAIGLVLGLMLGVFSAFFRHYWKNN